MNNKISKQPSHYVSLEPGSKHRHRALPANTTPAPRASTPPPAPVPAPAPAPVASNSVADKVAVSQTIQHHFALISQHNFAGAYALLGPNLQTGESSWVQGHQRDQISSIDVNVAASVDSPTSASASIISMHTYDKNGCQSWTGGWGLTNSGGHWLIDSAHLNSSRC